MGGLDVVAVGVAEVVHDVLLGIGLEHIIEVVVDVELGAAHHDALELREQVGQAQVLAAGDAFERDALIDVLDDMHLVHALVHHVPHGDLGLPFDIVLLDVLGDELHEGLPEFLRLARAHAGDLRELVDGDRVAHGHLLERGVLEEHPRLQLQFVRLLLAQVLEHGHELLIGRCSGTHDRLVIHAALEVAVVALLHELDGNGLGHEFLAGLGEAEVAVGLDVLVQESTHHGLAHDRHPVVVVLAFALAFAIDLELIALIVLDLTGLGAGEQVADELGAVALFALLHGAQHQGQVVLGLELFARVQAVVAALAVVLVVHLAEVVEEEPSAAHAGLGEAHGIGQQLAPDLLLGHGLALQELLELLDVLVAVEGHALAFTAITACAPGLLIIALEALGDVVVDHEAHIGLVDAHAEGDGSYDHIHILHEELVLVAGALAGVHASVIG